MSEDVKKLAEESYDNYLIELSKLYLPASSDRKKLALLCIEYAIQAERHRCYNICDAENEMGNPSREAMERIINGEEPLVIPGYNAPSEEEW